jgi:hypothetical protein
MGGAIALRAAARYSKNLHGVISSVPSAERFQARKMGLTVAVHFLKNPNKPFKIGDMVVEHASALPQVREAWHDDLKAKMEMSPKELMRFAVFMRETKLMCNKLNTLPVFFVQGLKDKLVKPKGTYELFEAVSSQDKNLFIIGNEEHLIFETFKQSNMLIDSITSWMDKHSQTKQADAINAAAPPAPTDGNTPKATGRPVWEPASGFSQTVPVVGPGASGAADVGQPGVPAISAPSGKPGKHRRSKSKRAAGT